MTTTAGQSTEAPLATAPAALGGEHRFSADLLSCVVTHLQVQGGDELVAEVLDRAGETRSPSELLEASEWSSYDQFRRLLEGVAAICGNQSLYAAGASIINYQTGPTQQALQKLGRPSALLSQIDEIATFISTAVEVSAVPIGETEWLVSQHFADGFEPFPAYCHFHAGLMATIPQLYGFNAGTVTEQVCQCEGAAACQFTLSWQEVDELTQRIEYLEYYTRLLEARLAGLQHTVTDLISSDNLEAILERIVASARRTVTAPGYVLALESLSAATRRVYSAGALNEAEAAEFARRVLQEGNDVAGVLATEVRSGSRSYGRLAAVDPSGVRSYVAQERTVLEVFASVAAAALEVASALDDSRRQADVAQAMSELLDEERSLLSRIVEALPHGVAWTDSTGAIEGCNQAFADLVGCPLDEVRGQRWCDLIADDDLAIRCALWADRVARSCEPIINTETTVPVGDERRVVLVSVVPLSCAGTDQRLLSIWADVSDQRSLEERLAESSRLESIGQLAAGVAHEINTPMQYIGDNGAFLTKAFGLVIPLIDQLAELAGEHGADTETIEQLTKRAKLDVLRNRIPRATGQVTEGVEAVSRIVRSLKTFAFPGGDDFEPVDVAQLLESTATVSRNEWKYVASLDLDVPEHLPAVRAVPGTLNQVFLNLVVNAAHAIEEHRSAQDSAGLGTITIACSVDDGWLETTVSDDGGGIPDAIRDKIYDQFFTTKAVGRGTGQGLAISRNIVTRHEGTIDFTTSPAGTTFTIRLPLWQGSDDPEAIG